MVHWSCAGAHSMLDEPLAPREGAILSANVGNLQPDEDETVPTCAEPQFFSSALLSLFFQRLRAKNKIFGGKCTLMSRMCTSEELRNYDTGTKGRTRLPQKRR